MKAVIADGGRCTVFFDDLLKKHGSVALVIKIDH